MTDSKIYIAIDLKSFYASVECMERGLDPMTTNLVVADPTRTEKTICLAVSPSLKAYGVPGRPRLFEVVQKIARVNAERRQQIQGRNFSGSSTNATELQNHPELQVDYIVAPPRMAHYIEHSSRIYNIYLKYLAPEDMHIYSIDEVFMDVSAYLKTYKMTAQELAATMVRDVQQTTGITATAGIGTNLYLCKVAMDIVAKHTEADQNGVRIAELNEQSYRQLLWNHRPLTDFWRVGRGYAAKLEAHGLYTMGDIARCSMGAPHQYHNEELLYKMFGINAELLIDHAWGYEPCTLAQIKAYRPSNRSLCSGQVLQEPYPYAKAKLVVREMAELLALDLLEKGLAADQIVLTIGYDRESLTNPQISSLYKGATTSDAYGRTVPKPAHGSTNLKLPTSSTLLISKAVMTLYSQIVNPDLLVRRITISANHVIPEGEISRLTFSEQLNLFTDYTKQQQQQTAEEAALQRERKMQLAVLGIKRKFGKNAVLKGTNLQDGATAQKRNAQIGGHKA